MINQFDIVENLNPVSRREYPFLLVLQHGRIASIRSVIVAPLTRSPGSAEETKLHPTIELSSGRYFVVMQELAAVPRAVLGKTVENMTVQRYAIIAALDLLFTGI